MIIEEGQATNRQTRLQKESDPTQIRTLNLQQNNDFKLDVKNPHIILIGGSEGEENHILYVYDYKKDFIIKSINTEKAILNMVFSPVSPHLFLNYANGGGIKVLNKLTLQKVRDDIEKATITVKSECTRNCLYTLDDYHNAFIRMSLQNFVRKAIIRFPEKELMGDFTTDFVRTPDQKSFLVSFPFSSKEKKGLIRRIDLESFKVEEFFVGGSPYRLALTPKGELIVGHQAGFISLHNPFTLEVLKDNLLVGHSPRIAITPMGKQAVVASFDGQISVINLQDWTRQIPDFQINQECWEMKVHPAGNCLFIATGENTLIEMDLSTWKVTQHKLEFKVRCLASYSHSKEMPLQKNLIKVHHFFDASILTG